MRRLRIIFATLLALTIAVITSAVLWFATPSSAFYRQINATVERAENGDWVALITRQLPRGSFTGRWSLRVWVRRGEASFVCTQPLSEPIPYDAGRGPTISYELPPSVTRCMNAAPPISITWTRQVMLWGWLPLRPSEETITINAAPPQRTPADG